MQSKFKFPMGIVAKDSVTGFQGLIIARNAHLFGCAQYGLAPQELNLDGSPKDTQYFDESRIEVVDASNQFNGSDDYNEIFPIRLGVEVKDKVSNFEGKALVAMESMHNCNSYYVEPPVDEKGEPRKGIWLDEGRLEIIGEGISPKDVAAPKRGSLFNRDLPKYLRED